jgi:D-allose transport system substrate-binding protein
MPVFGFLRVVSAAVFLSVVGIPGFAPWSASAEEEHLFILKGRGNVFWKTVYDGISDTAKAAGIRPVLLHTDDDQSPEAQLTICQTSLARKPRIVVLGAATKSVGIECFRQAAAKGIPFADIDGNVTVEDAKAAGLQMAFSVGSDNTSIGETAADFVAKHAGASAPKVLLIKGLPGSIVSEQRARGFKSRLASMLPQAQLVGEPAAYWDRMKTMSITLDYLQRDPDIKYIFSVSDVMTLGTVEALRVAHRQDKVNVISVDGIPDGRKAVQNGAMLANVAQLPYLMGKRAVELSLEVAKGGALGRTEKIATPLLTKESLAVRDNPELLYVR